MNKPAMTGQDCAASGILTTTKIADTSLHGAACSPAPAAKQAASCVTSSDLCTGPRLEEWIPRDKDDDMC